MVSFKYSFILGEFTRECRSLPGELTQNIRLVWQTPVSYITRDRTYINRNQLVSVTVCCMLSRIVYSVSRQLYYHTPGSHCYRMFCLHQLLLGLGSVQSLFQVLRHVYLIWNSFRYWFLWYRLLIHQINMNGGRYRFVWKNNGSFILILPKNCQHNIWKIAKVICKMAEVV